MAGGGVLPGSDWWGLRESTAFLGIPFSFNDYKSCRKNRVVVKAWLNVFSYNERQCPLCEEYDRPHVLFGCHSIRNEREIKWNIVLMCAPSDKISATDKMNDERHLLYRWSRNRV